MTGYQPPSAMSSYGSEAPAGPLVVVFERDDAVAVPVLSQLRVAGYDVRAARTPVELFDVLSKQLAALVLVDVGMATASRREFWVALDAQRRGRALQVVTFRNVTPPSIYDPDGERFTGALADVELHGPHDLPRLVSVVRQRLPLTPGGVPGAPAPLSLPAPGGAGGSGSLGGSYGGYAPMGLGQGLAPGNSTWEASRFAHPAETNPFAGPVVDSPFAQPYVGNPFAAEVNPPPVVVQPATWSAEVAPQSGDVPGKGGAWRGEPGVAATSGGLIDWTGSRNETCGGGVNDAWEPPEHEWSPGGGGRASDEPAGMWGGVAAAYATGSEYGAEGMHTAPVPAPGNVPAMPGSTDHALGSVLVQGALLTPGKLDVLRGIQAMLGNVDMNYKLGELALLFRFLSRDQLLAALLVSRGLVSPQQIAGLGRVKQELAASGMDHDLESLLAMFHILPTEQLRALRAELE